MFLSGTPDKIFGQQMLLVQAQVDKHILTRVYENVQSGVKRVCILASRW